MSQIVINRGMDKYIFLHLEFKILQSEILGTTAIFIHSLLENDIHYDSIQTSKLCKDLKYFTIVMLKLIFKCKKHRNMNFRIVFTLKLN